MNIEILKNHKKTCLRVWGVENGAVVDCKKKKSIETYRLKGAELPAGDSGFNRIRTCVLNVRDGATMGRGGGPPVTVVVEMMFQVVVVVSAVVVVAGGLWWTVVVGVGAGEGTGSEVVLWLWTMVVGLRWCR